MMKMTILKNYLDMKRVIKGIKKNATRGHQKKLPPGMKTISHYSGGEPYVRVITNSFFLVSVTNNMHYLKNTTG